MKTLFLAGRATQSMQTTHAGDVAVARDGRLSGVTRAIRQAYLQMFGIPDYDRYAEHMASHHPGAPLLSRREFCAWAIDRKYARKGPRCC
ncbi:YbdD/YjiX family protein [Burkholderia ubonensis]|uniref:YbdD/YjiX family protein n=1 Tax=Burkholderia ubonensis TaxID=101571 RepID=UPI0009B41289|nr:YbdD/YjiX family protein [Burkholderia ubonensis]MDY7788488.1 YbdD/YjiX family protein [Burkholderia ubonensis]